MLFVDSAALPNESYLQWHSAIMNAAIKKDPVITNNISKPGRITVKYVETNPTITKSPL